MSLDVSGTLTNKETGTMLRAAAWTAGLFAAGSAICHVFPAAWVEPLVLLGLGVILLRVSARGGPIQNEDRESREAA